MCVSAQAGDILHAVPGILPGSELLAGHIHGIGTAVDGCDADVGISRRCEKFEYFHYFFSASSCCLAVAPY